MGFWGDVAASFLANVFAAALVVMLYIAVQWFLGATDITVGYAWRFDGTMDNPRNLRPTFDIRNRSRSRTYFLANIAYLEGGAPGAPFDNTSIWGKELKPGTIHVLEAAPVAGLSSLKKAMEMEVHVRLQDGECSG